MRPHYNNQQNNFIGGWYHNDIALCDDIIQFHKESDDKKVGIFLDLDGSYILDSSRKDSNDVILNLNKDLLNRYLDHLQECIDEYIKLYPECSDGAEWCVSEDVNIQYYKPGGGYHKWHCERNSPRSSLRHLVFMTYLTTHDDLDEGRNLGGTAFKYQNLNMKAEKGLTLIWPSDFTHIHKSIACPDKEKYIITGWLSYK